MEDTLPLIYLNPVSYPLNLFTRDLLIQQSLNTLDSNGDQACELVRQALVILQEIEQLHLAQSVASTPAVTFTGAVGRPWFETREQLLLLIESKFTVPQIADMIGISAKYTSTNVWIWPFNSLYTEPTDDELDSIISDIHKEFPMCGNKQMSGYLLARGIRFQQHIKK